MKQILLTSLILLSVFNASGQKLNLDSLINILKTKDLTHKEQAELYDKIAIRYGSLNDYNKAIEYAEKGLTVASKHHNVAASLNATIGVAYYSMGENEKAVPYLDEALSLAVKANDKEKEASILMSIGAYYGRLGKYIEAQEYFIKALPIYESIGNKEKCAQIYGNIGIIHIALENHDRAIFYFKQMVALFDELDKPNLKMRPYYELGRAYLKKGDIENALKFTPKSVEFSRTYNSPIFEALGLGLLVDIYNTLGEYDTAIQYSKESISASEKTNDPTIISNAWKLMSDIYRNIKQYKESEETAYKAWELDSMSFTTRPDLLFNIANANLFLGNKDKAAAYFLKYTNEIKGQADKNFRETLIDMEVKYETQKKEIRIASLENERQLYTWLGIIGVLLAVALGFILWQKIRSARREKQLIATRSVLDGEMKERTRLAQDLHDRLSGNLSAVKIGLNNNKESLQSIHDKLDSCIEEIRRAAHNLMPISLQFGLKTALEDFAAQFPNVHFHFFGEERHVEKRKAFIIYCCASELVNNSLRHSGAKNINMQLVQSDKYVSLTVQDDGSGFDEKAAMKGIGLKNMHDRIASCDGKIDIATSHGKGTEITIELKTKDT